MKSSEKKGILILIIVSVIIIGILFMIKGNKNKKQKTTEGTTTTGEYVQTLEDGTKQGTSSKLNETKTVGDIEISNIQIREQSGLVTITAVVKNNSGATMKEFPLKLKLLNKSGEELQEVGAYVGTIKDGETIGINASVNMDISQIYDISIEI